LRCAICDRESSLDGYCQFHARAHEHIRAKYKQWKKALNVPWKEYLSEIAKHPLSGEWVKEVAQHMMLSEEQTDVKKRQKKCL
jgi:hypothetical protein